MKTREDYIKDFHKAFGQGIHKKPTVEVLKLRRMLIGEEMKELFADEEGTSRFIQEYAQGDG